MTTPQPPSPAMPPQAPTLNYQMAYSPNGENLGGALTTLAIIQLVISFFALLIFGGLSVLMLNLIDEHGFPASAFLVLLMPLVVLVILISLIVSSVAIFKKKKIGIYTSYISVALQAFMAIYYIGLGTYIFDKYGSGSEVNNLIGTVIITSVFLSIGWVTQLILLIVPSARNKVKQLFN